jgi:hypothetical protein
VLEAGASAVQGARVPISRPPNSCSCSCDIAANPASSAAATCVSALALSSAWTSTMRPPNLQAISIAGLTATALLVEKSVVTRMVWNTVTPRLPRTAP